MKYRIDTPTKQITYDFSNRSNQRYWAKAMSITS